jgi:hypothetical protein
MSLWDKAIASLPEADRGAFASATDRLSALQGFIYETSKVRDACLQKQWQFHWRGERVVLRDVAEKILVWVRKFKEIGDIAVQYDPGHAALPWATFRFVLEVRHTEVLPRVLTEDAVCAGRRREHGEYPGRH